MIWYDISKWFDMIWYDMIWYDMIRNYMKSRIQLCGELGSTRSKTVTLPIGSSVPTKNGCCTAVDISIEKYIIQRQQRGVTYRTWTHNVFEHWAHTLERTIDMTHGQEEQWIASSIAISYPAASRAVCCFCAGSACRTCACCGWCCCVDGVAGLTALCFQLPSSRQGGGKRGRCRRTHTAERTASTT